MSVVATGFEDEEAGGRDLRAYLDVVRRRFRVMVLVVIATVGVALGVTLLQDNVYRAEAQILIQPRSTDTIFNPNTGQRNDPERSLQTEIEVARSRSVEQLVPAALRSNAVVTSVSDTDVMAVSVRDKDATRATQSANAYAQAYLDFKRTQTQGDISDALEEVRTQIVDTNNQIAELDAQAAANPDAAGSLQQQRAVLVNQQAELKAKQRDLEVAASLNEGGARLLSQAETPTVPVEPKPIRTGLIALAAALVLALGVAFLVDYLDDSISRKEDLERAGGGVPVIGLIPSYEQRDRGPITLVSDWKSSAAEAYRSLRTSIQFMGLDKPLRVLQITSPNAAEGKTTTLANVGVALAGIGVRVVLIDLDLRRPRLHEVFNIGNDVGFTSVLLGRAELGDAMVSMLEGNDLLKVLPSGPIPPNPSELLSSPRVQKLLAEVSEHAELVLVDTPPVLPVTDAMVVSRNADAVILVAAVGTTSRRQVARATELLRQVGAPLTGAVLNRAGDVELYGYGYGYGQEPPEEPGRRARRQSKKAARSAGR